MLRQSAFTGSQRLLKGALHCHTTRSDGQCTPEEVIALHEQNGYDFLAITDHRMYNYRNFVPGSRLTILPGMEMDANITPVHPVHCFHSVWLGREQPNNPYLQDETFPRGEVADQHEFQKLLDEAHQKGQLTFYCHPQWSGTFTREFEQMQGIFAMELRNSGCAQDNAVDVNNGWIWDELLMQGKRIFGVAVDDGHLPRHHCKAWVRVNADNRVDSILDALRQGAFYASTGPEIYDFWIDDDQQAHVKCSPCASVHFYCAASVLRKQTSEDGNPLTEATLHCRVPELFPYLRVEVTDQQGNVAWSNPIFLQK